MIYLASAFSINMLSDDVFPAVIDIKEINISEASEVVRYMPESDGAIKNVIGHPDTAAVVGNMLEVGSLPANRESVQAGWGDIFIVAQYRGPRLPEGATALPNGATIKFYKVFVGD
jgi:hypothetical protein